MPLSTKRRIQFYIGGELYEKFISKYPIDQRNEIAKNLFVDYVRDGNINNKPESSVNDNFNDLIERWCKQQGISFDVYSRCVLFHLSQLLISKRSEK